MEKESGATPPQTAAIADAPNLRSLIEELEAATVGSRALDADIFWTINLPHSEHWPTTHRWVSMVPAYTTSIDAALTLVPEGWPITEMSWWPSVPKGYESENVARVGIMGLDYAGFGNHKLRFRAEAKTPALAFCIAALKARQTVDAGGPTGSPAGASPPTVPDSKE
jgi:hypothetical protein